MAIKNPRKWRFTWEAQSHSPTLKLFVFDSHTHTNTSNQCQNLEVNLNLPKHHVSITWVQQQDLQNQISLLVPIPKVLIDSESPVSYRALADHIEVKLVLLLPVDHPIVASSDSVLRLTQIADSHVSTPLLMDSDIKKLSLKKEGVHFYCRNCSTKLTKTPIRNFVEMPSVNWQEAADNWFGACCCSFGGISEKLVTRYANCYTCVTGTCLLNCTTVTLFKDDLVGCNFPAWDGGRKCHAGLASAVEDVTCGSTLDPGIIYRKTAGCDDQNELVHDFCGKLSFMGNKDENFIVSQQFDVNEKETNGDSLFCTLPVSGLSENVASAPGCCVHATHEIQDHVGEGCTPTLSALYQKTERNTADQISFRNGFLGNIFMARSYNLSKDIEWIEFLCPCCLTFLGAYPSSTSDAPIDGGVRLFKCYISTCLPIGGSDDIFRKYTLERMFTNQLLESAKDELSFRTLIRDLKTKSPMLQIVLLNPNAWCCTGYCSGMDSTTGPIPKLDLQPIIKVLFSDCGNNSESQSRILDDWQTKNLADDVFMLKRQIEELIKLLVSAKDTLPPSYTSIEDFCLSCSQR
ncbi:hypothetical protein AB3S75_004605 [Citrus x aurantiifolia]